MAKTIKDYPEALNRISETILSNYGRRVDTFNKFQTAFEKYMDGEKYTTEDIREAYMVYSDINNFAEKIPYKRRKKFDEEIKPISFSQSNNDFNKIGYIKGRQVFAKEWKITDNTTGKTYSVLRDSKGRILSKKRK